MTEMTEMTLLHDAPLDEFGDPDVSDALLAEGLPVMATAAAHELSVADDDADDDDDEDDDDEDDDDDDEDDEEDEAEADSDK